MADPPRYTDSEPKTGDNISAGPSRSRHRMPRWLKVSLIIAVAVVVLLVVLMLTGAFGGGHGPGQFGPGQHST
jgi:hypothetical protein